MGGQGIFRFPEFGPSKVINSFRAPIGDQTPENIDAPWSRSRTEKQPKEYYRGQNLTVQKIDVLQKGAVYKLHAGWFINRTPGEFMSCGLSIKLKSLFCGNPT